MSSFLIMCQEVYEDNNKLSANFKMLVKHLEDLPSSRCLEKSNLISRLVTYLLWLVVSITLSTLFSYLFVESGFKL